MVTKENTSVSCQGYSSVSLKKRWILKSVPNIIPLALGYTNSRCGEVRTVFVKRGYGHYASQRAWRSIVLAMNFAVLSHPCQGLIEELPAGVADDLVVRAP